MNLKRVSLGIAALLVLVSCGKNQGGFQAPPPSEHKTMVVTQESAVLENIYPATVKGQEDIEIRPRIDGFIDAIYVDEGSAVRKGQALFKINSPQSEQALLTAKASVSSAEASLRTAELNVSRIKPLADKGIVSNVQYETVKNAYETSKALLTQAKAALANAQATIGWTIVTSPVDGVVGTVPLRQGSLVDRSNVLTTIANTSNVYVYFSMNEKDLMILLQGLEGNTQAEKIKKMPEVSLKLADGTTYSEKGRISTIAGQVNVTTGSLNFRADFPNKQGILRSGFSGRVVVPSHVDGAFLIPQAATFAQQNKTLVYKVQGDSVVSALIAVLPMPDGKRYAVTSGLSEGDKIVSEGVAILRDGKKIIAK